MRSNPHSLRTRLTASIVLAGAVGLLSGLGILLRDVVDKRGEVRERTEFESELIARATCVPALLHDREQVRGLLTSLGTNPCILEAHAYRSDGTHLGSFVRDRHPLEGEPPTPRPEEIPVGEPGWIVQPLQHENESIGSLAVHFELPGFESALVANVPLLGLMVFGTTLAVLFLRRWVDRSVLRPIRGLSQAADVICLDQDYSIRAVRLGGGEIGQLVDTFNGMLTQVELRDAELQDEMERAEASMHAKSQFLATMSHELRTPMNGVIGMSELLIDTELTDDQRVFADTIQSSAIGLLAIINDILDFSKIESGNLELEDTDLDLRRVVEDSIGTLAHTANDKGLVLAYRIADDVPVALRGDPGRLRQVLLNLLSNAVKFTTEGDVELRVSMVSDEFHSVILRFEVEDTGIGIPADRMDRLFKSFSQVDVSDSRKYGGTGLGLVIAKEIVATMGGAVEVASTEGIGSTFHFTARFQLAESLRTPSETPPERSLRILVGHPHSKQRGAIASLIGSGHEVFECSDAEDCREVLRSAGQPPIEIAFLDASFLASPGAPARGIFESELAQNPDTRFVVLTDVRQASSAARRKGSVIRGFLACPPRHAEVQEWIRAAREGVSSVAELRPLPQNGSSAEDDHVANFTAPEGTIVLVAEDNLVNQRVASRFLEKLGAEVVLAGNGRDAVRKWREQRPDLVLMDLQMPEMDGLAASREIRRQEGIRGGRTPIIALTANVGEEVRDRCAAAGMDGHLPKPFQLLDLRGELARFLARPPRGDAADEAA